MAFNALMLLGFGCYVIVLILAGIVSLVVFHKIRKIINPVRDTKWKTRWKNEWIFLAAPFVLFYSVIPQFLRFSDLQIALYYSTAWYPSLGVAFLLIGAFIERKDEMLVTKTMLPAGISILATSIPLALLCESVKDYYGVMAVGLIATALMLTIYLICALYSFFKSYKALFE